MCLVAFSPGNILEIEYGFELIQFKRNSCEVQVDLVLTNKSQDIIPHIFLIYPADIFGPGPRLRWMANKLPGWIVNPGARLINRLWWNRTLRGSRGAERTSIVHLQNPNREQLEEKEAVIRIIKGASQAGTRPPFEVRSEELLRGQDHISNDLYRSPSIIKLVPDGLDQPGIKIETPDNIYRGCVYNDDQVGVPEGFTSVHIGLLALQKVSILQWTFDSNNPFTPETSRAIRLVLRPKMHLYDETEYYFKRLLHTNRVYKRSVVAPAILRRYLDSITNALIEQEKIVNVARFIRGRFISNGFNKPGTHTRISEWRIAFLHSSLISFDVSPYGNIVHESACLDRPKFSSDQWQTGHHFFKEVDGFAAATRIRKYLQETGTAIDKAKPIIEIARDLRIKEKTAVITIEFLKEEQLIDVNPFEQYYYGVNSKKDLNFQYKKIYELLRLCSNDYILDVTLMREAKLRRFAILIGFIGGIISLYRTLMQLFRMYSFTFKY